MGLVKLDSWSRGRVTLVGDAAYCPSPNRGMGTASAMVGAYILAGEIAQHCGSNMKGTKKGGLAAALKSYQEKFEPFIKQATKGVEKSGYVPSSPFTLFIMYLLVQLVSFLKIDIFGHFSTEDVKGWDLPDYPELRV